MLKKNKSSNKQLSEIHARLSLLLVLKYIQHFYEWDVRLSASQPLVVAAKRK